MLQTVSFFIQFSLIIKKLSIKKKHYFCYSYVQFLEVLLWTKKVQGLSSSQVDFYTLPVRVWILSVYCNVLTQNKNIYIM